MKVHELKVWRLFYPWILNGSKKFELRINDRDFKEYDVLHLREYDDTKKRYTGRECFCKVGFVLHGHHSGFGLQEGYCIMTIELMTT